MRLNPLLQSLRQEIYVEPYEMIKFSAYLNRVASTDTKAPLTSFLKTANVLMRTWERYFRPSFIHQRANGAVRQLMRREDENTSYNDIAPVNKAFHMAAIYFCDGPCSPALARHHENILPYLWQGADGMNCGGTNGTQVWDTAFSVIAIVEAGLAKHQRFQSTLKRAHHFLDSSQFRDNLSDPYRQRRKGGWPFSTNDNSYIVSDCAAEGLKAVLLLQKEALVVLLPSRAP